MTAPNHNHPERSDLEAFGVGLLDAAHSAAVEQHVAGCESCCDALQQAPDDTLVRQLREAVTLPPQAAPAGPVPSGQETVGHPSAAGDAPFEPPADLSRHPRYRLLKRLGGGGMGTVYLAEHGVMHRRVALKVIKAEYTSKPAAVERFQREIRAAAQLHHPNIVEAYDAEQAGDTHFLVMEYIDGVSLARLVGEKGPLPVAEACEYVRQAALGLQRAHERGMVHRDVKPHNMIRTADGLVKVLDFGLASVVECREGQLTDTNVVMGTPDYIAPEQAEDTHAADARSDIYALGCTLYQLLTGRPPFTYPSTLLKLVAHREEAPAPVRVARPDVPEELAAVLSRMMAKAPVDRYQTAAEVAAALAPFADATALPKPRPKSRRRLWIAAAVAAVCMAGLAAAVAAVVVRIQTDQGEVIIQTDDPNIEVVVTKGGKLVRIVDPQSKQTWELDTTKCQIGMADQPEGLRLELPGKEPLVLKRGDAGIFRVSRVPPVKEGPANWSVAELPEKPGLIRTLPLPTGQPNAEVVFSSDSRLVAIPGDRNPNDGAAIHVYETVTGRLVCDASIPGEIVSASYLFLPDGKHLLTCATLHDRRLWALHVCDLETGRNRLLTQIDPLPDFPYALHLSGDGKRLAVSMGFMTRVVDLDSGAVLLHREPPTEAAVGNFVTRTRLSRDGKWAYTTEIWGDKKSGGYDHGRVRIEDLEGKTPAKVVDLGFPDFTPFVDSATGELGSTRHGKGAAIEFRDAVSGKLVRQVPVLGDTTDIGPIVAARGGRRAIALDQDKRIHAVDLPSGKDVFAVDPIGADLAPWLSDDGRMLAIGTGNETRLYRLPDPLAAKDKP